MKKTTYKITVIENGGQKTYELESKKAKDKWLYEYLICQERLWAWEQWGNSNHKTFDKWFKAFIKPQWKISDFRNRCKHTRSTDF